MSVLVPAAFPRPDAPSLKQSALSEFPKKIVELPPTDFSARAAGFASKSEAQFPLSKKLFSCIYRAVWLRSGAMLRGTFNGAKMLHNRSRSCEGIGKK